MRVGVVIGCYAMPEVLKVQIGLLREEKPEAIVLADDMSPNLGEILSICQEEKIEILPNVVKMGHAGGYLSGLYKGLQWGFAKDLDVVAFLSQRLWILSKGWLAKWSQELIESGLPLMANCSQDPAGYRYIRTAISLFSMKHWSASSIELALPKRLGFPVEQYLYRLCNDRHIPILPIGKFESIAYKDNDLASHNLIASKFNIELTERHLRYFRDDPDYDAG